MNTINMTPLPIGRPLVDVLIVVTGWALVCAVCAIALIEARRRKVRR